MSSDPGLRDMRAKRARRWGRRAGAALGVLGLGALPWAWAGVESAAGLPSGARDYSTAEAPEDYRGPRPITLALNDPTAVGADVDPLIDHGVIPARGPESGPAKPDAAAPKPDAPRVASVAGRSLPPDASPSPKRGASPSADDPIAQAIKAISDCQARFAQVRDYMCTFHKRERINGRLTSPHVMHMKARTNPHSLYFKFARPNKGREAIYIAGRNGGRIVAHDVGLGKLVAGTMRLDPRGSMAMEENRHPVTEAGLGSLIDTIARHWSAELSPQESRVAHYPQVQVGNRACTMIESVHPRKRPDFLFYMVKLYIDREHGLPIRFEAYDWPRRPGAAPELVEEYTYQNLRVNVGLRDVDFDPANPQYSYGRF